MVLRFNPFRGYLFWAIPLNLYKYMSLYIYIYTYLKYICSIIHKYTHDIPTWASLQQPHLFLLGRKKKPLLTTSIGSRVEIGWNTIIYTPETQKGNFKMGGPCKRGDPEILNLETHHPLGSVFCSLKGGCRLKASYFQCEIPPANLAMGLG